MRQYNYLWLEPDEICRRLGLAIGCLGSLTPEETRRIPKLNENVRADVALHLLRPELVGQVCEACLKPLNKSQTKYCSTLCRNTHLAGRDERAQRLDLELNNDYIAQLIDDARRADLSLHQFVRMSIEYGRHQVLLFNRTGNSMAHEVESEQQAVANSQ